MGTLDKIGMSIGDYAAAILKGEPPKGIPKYGSAPIVKTLDESGPDYSHIKVDEAAVQTLLKGGIVRSTPKESSKKKSPDELVEEFQTLLIQAKSLIKEMTSVGMLGVNMAGPGKSNPKKVKLRKRVKPAKKTSNFLECMDRIKSRYRI